MATVEFTVRHILDDTTLLIYAADYPPSVTFHPSGAINDWTDPQTDWIDPPPSLTLIDSVFVPGDPPTGGTQELVSVDVPDDVRTLFVMPEKVKDRDDPTGEEDVLVMFDAGSSVLYGPWDEIKWTLGGTTYSYLTDATLGDSLPDVYPLTAISVDTDYDNALDAVNPLAFWEIGTTDAPNVGQRLDGADFNIFELWIHLNIPLVTATEGWGMHS